MRCPKCKTNWAPGVTTCEICNIDMEEYEAPQKPRKKKASGSIVNRIIGVVGILVGGGIIAATFILGGGQVALDTEHLSGLIFAGVFLMVGLYYTIAG